jgi:hypothetical protein
MYNYEFHSNTYTNLLRLKPAHANEIQNIFHYFINYLPIRNRMKTINRCFGLQISIETKCCEYFERIYDISGILIVFSDFDIFDED